MAAVLVAAGCDQGGPIQGTPLPNAPPDTEVTGAPPDLDRAASAVEFAWTGRDLDGVVTRFEWRISDNGPDGRVDYLDTLGLAWRATAATDSIFIVQAPLDSFAADVADPRQGPADYRFWQTHTFFIRAVDDRGARDPEPASVSFTATTLAPTVTIEVPPRLSTNTCTSAGRVLTFRWSGADPDGTTGVPSAVRYAFFEVPECLTQLEFVRNAVMSAAPDTAWSSWRPYSSASDSGKTVTLPRQPINRALLFAVQARDEAGAVTPVFQWGVNLRHVIIAATHSPLLSVSERFLGAFQSSTPDQLFHFEIAAGQPVEFEWSAEAGQYAGTIEAYRYGFGVADYHDPNDPGWTVGWGDGPLYRRTSPRWFAEGNPNFVVQARDNSGTVSRAIFQLDVIAAPRRDEQRDLLLISDWPRGNTSAEIARDRDWDQRWERLLSGAVPGFDVGLDLLDTHDDPGSFSFRHVNQYKAVLYFLKGGDLNSAFRRQLTPISRTQLRYNWLEVYQARVGNMLFCGPLAMNGTVEDPTDATWKYPIVFNVSDDGEAGFGAERLSDGTTLNRGTQRYPYTAWCLESIDHIRPGPGRIYGEAPGAYNQRRSRDCDALASAQVDPSFLEAYPSALGAVGRLTPTAERTTQFAQSYGPYQLDREEFYNTNTTIRAVTLNLRACQRVMFRMRTRRAEGLVAGGDTLCPPLMSAESLLESVPVGIVSSAYAESRPLRGAEDFLWGFNPLALQPAPVQSALLWILRERWQIATR